MYIDYGFCCKYVCLTNLVVTLEILYKLENDMGYRNICVNWMTLTVFKAN